MLTRNCDAAMVDVLARLDHTFEVALSRSFLPCKPSPAPLKHIMKHCGEAPSATVMVGDSIDDIQCGQGENCPLLARTRASDPPFAAAWGRNFLIVCKLGDTMIESMPSQPQERPPSSLWTRKTRTMNRHRNLQIVLSFRFRSSLSCFHELKVPQRRESGIVPPLPQLGTLIEHSSNINPR